eukprot:TRINITY_DN378_c0_g1_i1.p1 TRINITY_DN378_c0_g1~~TRINITY_DN378_c0_g1_i1.p1  ORF type:complete len:422 (-),score=59.37 TRINITY_DN378_c0_g1_i1:37-1302(-)
MTPTQQQKSFELTIRPGLTINNVDKNITRNFYVSRVRMLIAMVGLPARGKSYTANKITYFFQWLSIKTKVFNVVETRTRTGVQLETNEDVLVKILRWLDEDGEVAIFDATNTTKERRTQILSICDKHTPRVPVIFVENICDDVQVLAENFKQKIINSPEYKGVPFQQAAMDLKRRIHNHEAVYRTLDDNQLSFIKIINLQSKVECNRISGSMPQMLTGFLMSLHTQTRPIWFCRPADCEAVACGSITKNVITSTGELFAQSLAKLIHDRLPPRLRSKLIIYTGTSEQSIQTAKFITGAVHIQTTSLNKMQTGECRGMTTKILKEQKPDIYADWERDRFNYRFPGGESFSDLVQRLRQLVLEIEQLVVPALVISHQAPIQALYCYFKGKPPQIGPLLAVPSRTVIELISTQHGWNERHFKIM